MRVFFLLVLFSSAGCQTGASLPQESEPVAAVPDPAAMLEMQMEMMRVAQPGPEHEAMARGAGIWDVETTLTMPPMPGMDAMPPMKSTATATQEMVLGGRWMRMRTVGTMMGQEVESVGYYGYDRRHNEYVTVGLDTMGTYFVTGRGPRGEDGIIRMSGTDDDGYGGQDFVFEIDDSDPDRVVMRILFSKMGGLEFNPPHAMVEMVQTRRKDD